MSIRRCASAIVGLSFLFIACEPYLLYEDGVYDFKAPADKALCVVIRASGMYGNPSPIWLDQTVKSVTSGNTITSFEVDPGEHLVLTKISIMTKVKLNFKAGKVYYILQTCYPIPMIGVSTSLTPMPCAEAMEKLAEEKGKLKFSRINPAKTFDDLSADDVKEELEDWAEWSTKESEKAKAEVEYEGC